MTNNNVDLLPGSGICAKCGQIKVQTEEGVPKCLIHDVIPNPPSGKVVMEADPGHEEMIALLKKSGVRIEKGDSTSAPKTVTKTTAVESQLDQQMPIQPETRTAGLLVISLRLEDLERGGFINYIVQQAYDALDLMPFTTMKDCKRVIKVQEKIEKFLKGV